MMLMMMKGPWFFGTLRSTMAGAEEELQIQRREGGKIPFEISAIDNIVLLRLPHVSTPSLLYLYFPRTLRETQCVK